MTIWRATKRDDTIMIAIEGVSHITCAQDSCK